MPFQNRARINRIYGDCVAFKSSFSYTYSKDKIEEVPMKTVKIKGMSCGHCVTAVTKALYGIEGIKGVTVDLPRGEATFEEEKAVDMQKVKDAVGKAGFEVV
jgi:copper chaperone